jgi:cysteine-rich repeat protein
VVEDDEECDLGRDNALNGECLPDCTLAICGDGIVWEGVEECDDGNDIDTDACTNECKHAVCGDGIVWEGVEECDDGNDIDTDACTNECKHAVCGDGIVWEGVEDCDDGPNNGTSVCRSDCTWGCGGTLFDPGNGIDGCWYTAPVAGLTCEQVCTNHGGFNAAASQHTGNAVGQLFWPDKADGPDWESIECSSVDNDTNWGANGDFPNAFFTHPSCIVNCACMY